jgi:crotonobetainyl-CoA:carnitine CoA-transferase CaiB-like acyl-CoA transferase
MARPAVLEGLVVAERGGRLASAVASGLLGGLGASVVRLEDTAGRPASDPEAWHRHPVALAGKTRVTAHDDGVWSSIADGAHVAFASSAEAIRCSAPLRVLLTAFGSDNPSPDACDLAVQAASGAMAVTGVRGGPPCVVRTPLFEALAGLNAATSVLAALRAGTRDCTLDLALVDSAMALGGTLHAQALADPARRFRQGAGHPLCSPWNAYRASDAWLTICIASDDQWTRFAGCIGRCDLAADETLRTSPGRVAQAARIDAAVDEWLRDISAADAVRRLQEAAIPASLVRRAGAEAALALQAVATDNGRCDVAGPPVALLGTPLTAATRIAAPGAHVAAVRAAPYPRRTGTLPLAGLRVIEIGPFTAGPLAGRYLADLGAEVIKVEPPGGENSRGWLPGHDGISTYFANYNCGKRSVELDLADVRGAGTLRDLVGSADVLLQNLKPGALARLGLGPEALVRDHPRLIACSISGQGSRGAPVPALDTVVQAATGLMSLVDAPVDAGPVKAGFSLGDLGAAHAAAFGVVAAVLARDRDGAGQMVDVSMHDALVWLTQFGWEGAMPAYRVEPRGGGHWLHVAGEPPIHVSEVADALVGDAARRRHVLHYVEASGGAAWPVLASALRWRDAPPCLGTGVPDTGSDNGRMLH